MKICTKCNLGKDESEFHKNKKTKDRMSKWCKECFQKWRDNNKDKKSEYDRQYYVDNAEKRIEYVKQYYVENPQYKKEYYQENKEEILNYGKEWRSENKERVRELKKENYCKNKENPVFKLRRNVSKQVYKMLKENKNNCSILQYLPYSMQKLKQHIESLWEPWMNWQNYGKYDSKKRTWHIDHIIPQSLLPYDSMEHPNFQKCWALSNLRPLEAMANMKKGNKLISETI